jgi:hypothetical protein
MCQHHQRRLVRDESGRHINAVLWRNFSERGIHEMAVKTKALTRAYYGRDARYA